MIDLQKLLNKWNIQCELNSLLSMWNQPHRFYHTINHLDDLITQIKAGRSNYTETEYEKLLITALFHDCIYDPMRLDNEEKSADFFIHCCPDKLSADHIEIKNMILDTKTHQSSILLSECFNRYDMNIVERDLTQLLVWEDGIYREFKTYGQETYKKGRLKFLASLLKRYPKNSANLLQLIDYIKNNY